jgi:thymidylate kinase
MRKSVIKYDVIYIYGPDGSGKSTICKELVKLYNNKGINVTYRWMRFNHYTSKVLNAIGHLMGLSYYKTYPDGTRIGYHQYYKSRFFSTTYCMFTIFDSVIALIFKLWLPLLINKKIVIVDRFVFDTMVDLAIDTHNSNLPLNWQGILLKKILPPRTLFIYIDVDKDIIFKRRPDIKWDENFSMKMKLYKKVYELYGLGRKVNNNGKLNITLQNILGMLE